MEEIKESEHKNYLPSYPFSFEEIIENFLQPSMKDVFFAFSEKIHNDAQKDGEKGRNFLKQQWEKAASCCKRIAELSEESDWDSKHEILVEEIINMDYSSVSSFFGTFAKKFKENTPLHQELKTLEELFAWMWKVSEKHTKVISKELVETLNQ